MGDDTHPQPLKARPTTYKGIRMRSRLEAGYAAWLDAMRWQWAYEPEAFASEAGQYLPDFRIEQVHDLFSGRTSRAYVEVKPTIASIDVDAVFQRMEVIWDSEPDAQLLIQVGPHDADTVPRCRAEAHTQGHTVAPLVLSHRRTETSSGEFRNWLSLIWLIDRRRQPMLGAPVTESPWPPQWWKGAAGSASPGPATQARRHLAQHTATRASDWEVLRHAVHSRDAVVPWLSPELFTDARHHAVLKALDEANTIAEAIATSCEETADLLARLVVEEPTSDPDEVVRFHLSHMARTRLTDLRRLAISGQEPADVLQISAFLGRCIDDLRHPDASHQAAERLLQWLTDPAPATSGKDT